MKTRLVTALILATIVVSGLFYLPPSATAGILGVFLVIGAWEWTALMAWKHIFARFAYVVLLAIGALAIWHWNGNNDLITWTLHLALVWWLVALVLVVQAQKRVRLRLAAHAGNPLSGAIVLLAAWSSIVWLLHNDKTMLLALFILVWTADGAAYFVGRRFGRRRLASNVSPGKSWEGVAGGLGFGAIAAALVSKLTVLSADAQIAFIIVAVVTIAISVVGDLFESLVKRNAGLKDSGQLLPGHGGVLDRIDGLVAAAPIFCAGMLFWVYRL